MKVTGYLVVSNRGNLRVTKTATGVRANELQVKIVLDIPERFFARPVPVAHIDIPVEAIADPSVEGVVTITAAAVADALRLDAAMVRDGLTAMMEMDSTDLGSTPIDGEALEHFGDAMAQAVAAGYATSVVTDTGETTYQLTDAGIERVEQMIGHSQEEDD